MEAAQGASEASGRFGGCERYWFRCIHIVKCTKKGISNIIIRMDRINDESPYAMTVEPRNEQTLIQIKCTIRVYFY